MRVRAKVRAEGREKQDTWTFGYSRTFYSMPVFWVFLFFEIQVKLCSQWTISANSSCIDLTEMINGVSHFFDLWLLKHGHWNHFPQPFLSCWILNLGPVYARKIYIFIIIIIFKGAERTPRSWEKKHLWAGGIHLSLSESSRISHFLWWWNHYRT